MIEERNGSGRFTSATLHPQVVVTNQDMVLLVDNLHKKANKYCFIANSLNFPVKHEPACYVA